jgi:bifunctional non-homologous end joining protein LigD
MSGVAKRRVDDQRAMPGYVAPMKATLGELPSAAERAAWSYELKWDGMRVVTAIDGTDRRAWSGNHIEVTHRFPELEDIGSVMAGRPAILDGEVVVLDEAGRPDFGAMQTRMHVDDAAEARRRAATMPVVYMVFDVVHFDGHDLTSLPLDRRLDLLDQLFTDDQSWRRSVPSDDGVALLEVATRDQLEGVMAKRRDSRYVPGKRSPSWRKVKVRLHDELVVGGWLPGAGGRAGRLGALLVGYHDPDGTFRFAGRVGSGFNDAELTRLGDELAARARDDDPFDPPLRRMDAPGARFVQPELVVEVAYAGWTNDGRLRHPSYLGRRFDKAASDVVHPGR